MMSCGNMPTLFGNHNGKRGEDPRDPLQLLDFRLWCAVAVCLMNGTDDPEILTNLN